MIEVKTAGSPRHVGKGARSRQSVTEGNDEAQVAESDGGEVNGARNWETLWPKYWQYFRLAGLDAKEVLGNSISAMQVG